MRSLNGLRRNGRQPPYREPLCFAAINDRPISFQDAALAASARSRSAVVATRHTRDLTGCGIALQDPWAT